MLYFLLDLTGKTIATKANVNKKDFMKLKIFCTAKEIIIKMKGEAYWMCENICKPYIQ